MLEGPSENTVVPNRHCCTAKEPRDQSLDTLFLMGYPVRKQGSQKLFRRAAPTGFICLLQKMPPGHHLQKWQPQDPGSKLERDRFLFLCLSDLAVWQLFPYNSFSQALQRSASLFPICRWKRFKKSLTEFNYIFFKVPYYSFSSFHFLHQKNEQYFCSIEFPALRWKWCAGDVLQAWPHEGCIHKTSQERCKEYWGCMLDGVGKVSHKLF